MEDNFELRITLGNEAMQSSDDIAEALEQVVSKLRNGRDGGYIIDANGNTVGEFKILSAVES